MSSLELRDSSCCSNATLLLGSEEFALELFSSSLEAIGISLGVLGVTVVVVSSSGGAVLLVSTITLSTLTPPLASVTLATLLELSLVTGMSLGMGVVEETLLDA